jgi:hypothetical protein
MMKNLSGNIKHISGMIRSDFFKKTASAISDFSAFASVVLFYYPVLKKIKISKRNFPGFLFWYFRT